MRKVFVLAVFLIASSPFLSSKDIKIRLFYSDVPEAVVIKVANGSYLLDAGGPEADTLKAGSMLFVSVSGDKITMSSAGRSSFSVDSLSMTALDSESSFGIRVPGINAGFIEYEGDVGISPSTDGLKVINSLDIERYIAAVVQAEGGYRAHPEYFKTQAVIARTYAWLHLGKHGIDGYDLCDDVHCQVYRGRCTEDVIYEAAIATAGLVVTGADSILILTPFHSNCGGETVDAAEVWLSGTPYLKPVIDPYCQFSPNAVWEKVISRKEWESVLSESGNGYAGGSVNMSFDQPARKEFYITGSDSIPLTYLRSALKLRSAFFSVVDQGDSLLLRGRGYGHGVGLCQEGAMVMAQRGFDFERIIKFYYNNVIIIDVKYSRPPLSVVNTF